MNEPTASDGARLELWAESDEPLPLLGADAGAEATEQPSTNSP